MDDQPNGHGRHGAEGPVIAVIGAGPAGLCLGIRLKRAGFSRFTIFEKSADLGGTWHDNTYPGAGCDVPSHLYCFSFEPNPDWSRKFSGQPEIRRYLAHCARKYGLPPHIRFGTEIRSARFDEAAGGWRLLTADGAEEFAHVVVSATGQLNRPHVPALPGLESFRGAWFHSARWDHDRDLSGRRVAVIGSGASAVQIVPRVAETAERVTVFQRSPHWVLPRQDREYTALEKWLFRRVPGALRLYRHFLYLAHEATFFGFLKGSWLGRRIERRARRHLCRHVADRRLRAALTPADPAGCKRLLISDDYYPALTRPSVDVVTDPIREIAPDGVVTADGTLHRADTLIFTTGFEASSLLAPMRVEGLGGRTLKEAWCDGAEAYLGVAVAGFPNLFLLSGPNTNLGHNSIIFMIECQVNYIVRCIRELARAGLRWLDVRREAMTRFNAVLGRRLDATVWAGGCTSWYKTSSGKITNNWPGFSVDYWRRTRRPNFADFVRRR